MLLESPHASGTSDFLANILAFENNDIDDENDQVVDHPGQVNNDHVKIPSPKLTSLFTPPHPNQAEEDEVDVLLRRLTTTPRAIIQKPALSLELNDVNDNDENLKNELVSPASKTFGNIPPVLNNKVLKTTANLNNLLQHGIQQGITSSHLQVTHLKDKVSERSDSSLDELT